jgi:hypothetical protein
MLLLSLLFTLTTALFVVHTSAPYKVYKNEQVAPVPINTTTLLTLDLRDRLASLPLTTDVIWISHNEAIVVTSSCRCFRPTSLVYLFVVPPLRLDEKYCVSATAVLSEDLNTQVWPRTVIQQTRPYFKEQRETLMRTICARSQEDDFERDALELFRGIANVCVTGTEYRYSTKPADRLNPLASIVIGIVLFVLLAAFFVISGQFISIH